MEIRSAKDLIVYQKAYQLAMAVFEVSKGFPPEERYALTGQMRRSSRSVCLNLREAWAKRRYEAHFISKLTDCDGENSETDSSLDFARDCGYITAQQHANLTGLCRKSAKCSAASSTTPPHSCSLPPDLRPLTSDLCPLPSALCPLPSASCPLPPDL